MKDYSVSYSFGGTKDKPLVSRLVPMVVDDVEELTASRLQEVLLERTELIIKDLCTVFDEACEAFVASSYTNRVSVDVMMGACAYCVYNILVQAPSNKYAFMFTRVQKLLNLRGEMLRTMGDKVVDVLSAYVLPIWETLREIDRTFAEDLSVTPPSA
jgi:hypothetical protein